MRCIYFFAFYLKDNNCNDFNECKKKTCLYMMYIKIRKIFESLLKSSGNENTAIRNDSEK